MRKLTRSKLKVTVLLSSIVAIGVVSFAGWYTYQHVYSHRTALSLLASTNQVPGSESAVATVNSQQQSSAAVTWITYTSPVGNFSFNYPSTWSVSGDTVPGGNGYYINILPVNAHTPRPLDNYFTMEFFVGSNPDSTSPSTRIPYGTTQKLSNGVNVWIASPANSTGGRPSSTCPEMQLINADTTHLSYALSNGQYLALQGGYCENLKDVPSAAYNEQLASQNWRLALSIVESLQFN